MDKMKLAWIELIVMSILSLIFIISGIINKRSKKKKAASCTKETDGTVVKHAFFDKGRMEPVVEYKVKGKKYKARRRIRGVKPYAIGNAPIKIEDDAYEDEKGWLIVKLGPYADLKKVAERLWPKGSKLKVYYNPDDPKICYVERPNPDMLSFPLLLSGFAIWGVSLLIFFLMRL